MNETAAESYFRLVTNETTETKSQLLTRLVSLQVWGVPAIKLTQEVHEIKVTEDTGQILFDDVDDSKLEIYLSIKSSRKAIVDFELSNEFIRYCGITDHNFQKLVLPIIQYPHEEIEKLLEEHGLDELDDHNERFTDLRGSASEDSSDESSPIFQAGTIPSPRTPSSGMTILVPETSSQVSRPSSILRDRIPELDQSISSVRVAAALPSTTPTLIITPSKIRTNSGTSSDSTSRVANDVQHSTAGVELLSAGNVRDETKLSTPSSTELGPETRHDAFDFGNFHSEFSEAFGLATPSQNPRPSSTQRHSVPRYSWSPRSPRMEPDSENAMHGLQMQKIGLLGETFVSNASRSLVGLGQTPCSQLIGQRVALQSPGK